MYLVQVFKITKEHFCCFWKITKNGMNWYCFVSWLKRDVPSNTRSTLPKQIWSWTRPTQLRYLCLFYQAIKIAFFFFSLRSNCCLQIPMLGLSTKWKFLSGNSIIRITRQWKFKIVLGWINWVQLFFYLVFGFRI